MHSDSDDEVEGQIPKSIVPSPLPLLRIFSTHKMEMLPKVGKRPGTISHVR